MERAVAPTIRGRCLRAARRDVVIGAIVLIMGIVLVIANPVWSSGVVALCGVAVLLNGLAHHVLGERGAKAARAVAWLAVLTAAVFAVLYLI
ncbi:hypothetical protein [Sciscionella sediminilitoris]|uniref:hypothetical protein n=1 Tax=Sciscionella sediminilitoris TaxID=1445613 RepID=UPI0012E1C0F8|nr:hypothetical protein [Sciscionella sp. SE31]